MFALLSPLFDAVVQALPRLFLVGAPFLLTAIVIAALADAKLPGNARRDLAG